LNATEGNLVLRGPAGVTNLTVGAWPLSALTCMLGS